MASAPGGRIHSPCGARGVGMKIALVTDAWMPQVNGVVTTLVELVRQLQQRGHEVLVIHPGLFRTRPCPGYAGIDLAVRPFKNLAIQLEEWRPDSIHLATEGPLGWAGRKFCIRNGLSFTTAFHTRFPEILHAALRIPLAWGYALFRHFHRPSAGVMVPTREVLSMLARRGFRHLRSWTHGVDTQLFPFEPATKVSTLTGPLAHPVCLYVGRVSYEKNIEAFLQMETPGTKVVCGVGPLEAGLRARYPHVRWLGILDGGHGLRNARGSFSRRRAQGSPWRSRRRQASGWGVRRRPASSMSASAASAAP